MSVVNFENVGAFNMPLPVNNGVFSELSAPDHSGRIGIYSQGVPMTLNAFKSSTPGDIATAFTLAYDEAKDDFKDTINKELPNVRVDTMPILVSSNSDDTTNPFFTINFVQYITEFVKDYKLIPQYESIKASDVIYLTIPIAFTPPDNTVILDKFYLSIKYTIS